MTLPGDAKPYPVDETFSLLTSPVGAPVECGGCGEQVVPMRGGHYRLDARDFSRDRLRCKVAGGHRPVVDGSTPGLPAAMRRTPPPWSGGDAERPYMTGDPS